MKYETIQGDPVPVVGFGTWRLSGRACIEAVRHALDVGYRHVDTAEAYGNEREVGSAVRQSSVDREQLFLTTKVWHTHLHPRDVRQSAEESLRNLQTDYVDLLLIHWPSERDAPLEDTLDALLALQEEEKTRHIGVSNFPPSLVERALDHAPLFCNQVEYHPYLSQPALLEQARSRDLLLTAYAPLARGRVLHDATIQKIAEAHGTSAAQVAIRWLIQQERVAAIPKAASARHREANIDVFDFELSRDEMGRIARLNEDHRLVNPASAPSWER